MRIARSTALRLLVAAMLALGATAAGAADISRCTGVDGAAVYTDGSCAALGAREAPMPANLLRTLGRDGSDVISGMAGPSVGLGQLRPMGGTADGNPPRTYAGCPRTPQQLEAAFQESVATGDVNELAAIYDWTDVSGRQSRDLLRRLERISKGSARDTSGASSGFKRRAGCLLLSL